jgi:hypothetical protein
LIHVKIIATVYYFVGRDNPFVLYGVNVLAAAISTLLMFAFGRGLGLGSRAAAAAAAPLVTGPMFLFVHSELLREPFIIVAFLMFVLGLYALIRIDDGRPMTRGVLAQLGAAVLLGIGFVGISSFRPYLMLSVLVALGVTFGLCVLLPIVAGSSRRIGAFQGFLMVTTLVGLMAFVIPQMKRVAHYSGGSASAEQMHQAAAASELAKRLLRQKIDAFAVQPNALTHDDIEIPTVCTVKWRPTGFVPMALESKAESLACAREEHLIFCDPIFMGNRADRGCDLTMFESLGDVFRHLPVAALWSVAVPYPNMWLDGFGSGGTGLRRAGYVVDGVVSYTLLPGLLGLVWNWRRRPDVVALMSGLLTILLIYGLAVPTQFILARLRLGVYLPLMVIAFYGWTLTLHRARASKVGRVDCSRDLDRVTGKMLTRSLRDCELGRDGSLVNGRAAED